MQKINKATPFPFEANGLSRDLVALPWAHLLEAKGPTRYRRGSSSTPKLGPYASPACTRCCGMMELGHCTWLGFWIVFGHHYLEDGPFGHTRQDAALCGRSPRGADRRGLVEKGILRYIPRKDPAVAADDYYAMSRVHRDCQSLSRLRPPGLPLASIQSLHKRKKMILAQSAGLRKRLEEGPR